MKQFKITKLITNRESDSLTKYLGEISSKEFQPVSTEEELEIVSRYKSGDEKAKNELVNKNLRFVVSVAKQYQNMGLPLGDLVNDGNVGLIIAADKFDDTRGFKFISYAVWWVRQSILQSLAENARKIRLPLNKVTDVNRIKTTAVRLEQTLEREPTNEEISEALNEYYSKREYDAEFINQLMSSERGVLSLEKSMTNEEESGSLLDILESDDEKTNTDFNVNEEDLRIEMSRYLSKLKDREKIVLTKIFGLDREPAMSISDVAMYIGLTAERVRQIKDQALKKIEKVIKKNKGF